ncbi:MAG: hypothetical protein JNJ99_17420 [Crocinitomicaceae bacterium]|nr:hypothetical protein [Crocinitomicaceae bacterium]
MLKKLLFLFAGIFFLNFASAQTQPNTTIVGNEKLAAESEKLGILAGNVNTTYQSYLNSATATKTESVRIKQEYSAALDAYLSELNSSLTLKRFATLQTELQTEISKVTELKTAVTGSGSR